MGLRSGLPNLRPSRRRVADLAAPIQLAPAAQQSNIKNAHQPPRSYRGQPVEAPHLVEWHEDRVYDLSDFAPPPSAHRSAKPLAAPVSAKSSLTGPTGE